MAGIFAGRADPGRRVLLLDGARHLGAKILVAGGGRCNVTHDQVEAEAYAGSSRNAIRKVLRRFDVPQTIAFFRELGVTLRREDSGKLFPTTDDAHTVLEALLRAAGEAGVQIAHPFRVEGVACTEGGFRVSGAWGAVEAGRVVLATGGRALPKSGSDGAGYRMARALGHTLTARIFPALVPLTLPGSHALLALSGISADVRLEVQAASGRRLAQTEGAALCTHFGLSGPAVLDISRYYIDARAEDPEARLVLNWLPGSDAETLERTLQASGRTSCVRVLAAHFPERLARTLCELAGVDPAAPAAQLSREARRALARTVTALALPVSGDRGYTYAEVTAGGVPLSEIRLETMESRVQPGLFLCGELCDVDGRIGGYNFQWAWSSGYVAGVSV